MSKMLDRIKRSVAKEYSFPSFNSPYAQAQRNLAMYSMLAEFLAFIPFAILISFAGVEYWHSRMWAYLGLAFVIVTGLAGLSMAGRIDVAHNDEHLILKRVKTARRLMLTLVVIYLAVFTYGAATIIGWI
jgi:hypothetical protein